LLLYVVAWVDPAFLKFFVSSTSNLNACSNHVRAMVVAMHKVSNDAAVSSIDFNKLNTIDITESLKMLLDK